MEYIENKLKIMPSVIQNMYREYLGKMRKEYPHISEEDLWERTVQYVGEIHDRIVKRNSKNNT